MDRVDRPGEGIHCSFVADIHDAGSYLRASSTDSIREDPLLIAVARSHRLASRRTVDLDELAGEPWIAASTEASDTLLGVWPSLQWRPNVAFIAREWTAKLGLVAAGLGVTVLPGLAAAAVREDVALVRVRGEQTVVRAVALARRSGSDTPPARAFAEALHEVASNLLSELCRRIGDR